MRPLTASHLLALWESGLDQPLLHRALALLAAVYPETSPETLAALPIGQRDARLLTLRASVFGPRLNSLATCPTCGERLELTFDVDDIRTPELPPSHGEPPPDGIHTLTEDGYTLTYRLPNSLDLAAISHPAPDEDPRQQLFARCLLTATHKGKSFSIERLPEKIVQALTTQMAESDPQADVQLALTCPACGHDWQATFDILPFLWAEIHAWAQRLLREIHLLASAYGWSESEILALSPWRRAMYLQMVTQ